MRVLCAAIPHFDAPRVRRALTLGLLAAAIGGVASNQSWAYAKIAEATKSVQSQTAGLTLPLVSAALQSKTTPAPPWPGVDVDHDGRADFMNPTGHPSRQHDAYGSGQFGVSRDGGERMHEGVDFISTVGQEVKAPMSGYVTHVGWAYADDATLRTVEITNPALNYVARILYVSPAVEVGQAVAVGQVIGQAQSLQEKYPGGMTNHVHLQIARKGQDWTDCSRLIPSAHG